jgi:KDO2-lipid IV(A) lauroyltransferase
MFRAVADAATVRNGQAVRQLRSNLRRVVGPAISERDLDELVGKAMRSYARYWLETFRLPKMDKPAVVANVNGNTVGAEHVEAALARGRGYVIAVPHAGNYDVAGLWVVDRFGSFTTVAERLRPESLFDRFVAYRESLGMEVVALTGGERAPTAVLTERLRAGGGVCLVADRDLSAHGMQVDFFALLPVGLWFTDDGGWAQRICAPIELPEGRLRDRVQAGTQALADRFAELIAAHPSDWHMLQKLWLDDLDPERR